jgi:RNA polymerase sigma factor (sigma-70 family)
MDQTPDTRASLLVRLRDAGDEQAWAEFTAIYGPFVKRLACRRGLQDADADDLSQEVFRTVARAIERQLYDPERGSFRGWLFRIARNLVANFLIQRFWEPPSGPFIIIKAGSWRDFERKSSRWKRTAKPHA